MQAADICAVLEHVLCDELVKHALSESKKAVASISHTLPLLVDPRAMCACMSRYASVAPEAAVAVAAVVEYIAAEVLELAGNAARDNQKSEVGMRHVLLAVGSDQDLLRTFEQLGLVPFVPGGVVPCILRVALKFLTPSSVMILRTIRRVQHSVEPDLAVADVLPVLSGALAADGFPGLSPSALAVWARLDSSGQTVLVQAAAQHVIEVAMKALSLVNAVYNTVSLKGSSDIEPRPIDARGIALAARMQISQS
jgi:hypothetical protein